MRQASPGECNACAELEQASATLPATAGFVSGEYLQRDILAREPGLETQCAPLKAVGLVTPPFSSRICILNVVTFEKRMASGPALTTVVRICGPRG